MDISVIIADSDDLRLRECVKSIDENVETIVSLNGPTPELEKLVSTLNVKTCFLPNRDLSSALNRGIELSSNDKVLIIDSDCTFEKGTIKKLYDALDDSLIVRGTQIYDHAGIISKTLSMARNYHANPIPSLNGFIRAYKPLAFRKEIRESLGGFYYDPDLRLSEDYEMDIRRKKAGINIKYVPEALVHHCPLTLLSDLRSAFRYGADRHTSVSKGMTKPKKGFVDSMIKLHNRALPMIRTLPTAYMIIWTLAYDSGYYAQKYLDINRVRK